MLKLEAKFNIDLPINHEECSHEKENEFFNTIFNKIIHEYLSFTYDIKYILIETMYTHRLLKRKNQYVYENLRKKLENDPEVVIVETDLNQDPKIQNVPIIKDNEFYKLLMKYFNGYVAFKYQGPITQIKQCIEYLNSLGYCDFCSYSMIYEISLYKTELHGSPLNFIYVKLLTA